MFGDAVWWLARIVLRCKGIPSRKVPPIDRRPTLSKTVFNNVLDISMWNVLRSFKWYRPLHWLVRTAVTSYRSASVRPMSTSFDAHSISRAVIFESILIQSNSVRWNKGPFGRPYLSPLVSSMILGRFCLRSPFLLRRTQQRRRNDFVYTPFQLEWFWIYRNIGCPLLRHLVSREYLHLYFEVVSEVSVSTLVPA